MKAAILFIIALFLGISVCIAPASADETVDRTLLINGERIEAEVVGSFERQFSVRIPDGDYWYDAMCGAWGLRGGPTLGFTLPGIPLGGPLSPGASGGSSAGTMTGVFINGREIHASDHAALIQLVPVQPGRYWVDHVGNAGFEGMPPALNLWQIAASKGRGRSYNRATAGGYIGSDGQTSYFFDPTTGSSVMVGQ